MLDVLKGVVPSVGFGAVDHRAGLLAGFAAVLGHVTSPFLRGRGGKGVATTAGAVLGSQPLWAPVLVVVWLAVLGVSRWIALASMSAAVSLLVVALVLEEDRRLGGGPRARRAGAPPGERRARAGPAAGRPVGGRPDLRPRVSAMS